MSNKAIIEFGFRRKGYRMVPSNAKCSQKLNECLLARAHKFFKCSHARIFVKIPCCVAYKHNLHLENKKLTLEAMFPVWETEKIGETLVRAMNECFWQNAPSFCRRLLKLTGVISVPGSRVTLPETYRL